MTKNRFSFIKQVAEIHLCFIPSLEETALLQIVWWGLWDGPVPLGNPIAFNETPRELRSHC